MKSGASDSMGTSTGTPELQLSTQKWGQVVTLVQEYHRVHF